MTETMTCGEANHLSVDAGKGQHFSDKCFPVLHLPVIRTEIMRRNVQRVPSLSAVAEVR